MTLFMPLLSYYGFMKKAKEKYGSSCKFIAYTFHGWYLIGLNMKLY